MQPLQDPAYLIAQLSSLQSLHIFISPVWQEFKFEKNIKLVHLFIVPEYGQTKNQHTLFFTWVLKGRMEIT